MKNNCQDCGCDDKLPVNCYDGDCLPADKCDNTFDLGCVTYTGDPLICGGQTLLNTNESLESGLLNITTKICDSVTNDRAYFEVTFTDLLANQLQAQASGGTPPYSYEWSVERSDVFASYTADGPMNSNIITLTRHEYKGAKGSRLGVGTVSVNSYPRYRHYFILLKLKVTDSNNKVDYKSHLYWAPYTTSLYE